MKDKVVLAFSGGLDTTVAIPWLSEEHGLDVIAVAVDVGQVSEPDQLVETAMKAGAKDAMVIDARQQFASDFVLPALRANALYQAKYPLVSALSRPAICLHLSEVAKRVGAAAVAHGCTGKGNDQVRFEVALSALLPETPVLGPIRQWGLTREQAIEYGTKRSLPLTVRRDKPYSIDENMWGRTIECGLLEDPFIEPPDDVWERTADPMAAPETPAYLEIGFERGNPVELNGKPLPLSDLVAAVDRVCGSYGFGRVDMIEDRVIGIKSREIYEVPGALALIAAHRDLEELTLDRDTLRVKRQLEQRWAELVYEGFWFSPLKDALDAFFDSTSRHCTGTVRLKAAPGNVSVVGRQSPSSLYDLGLATYDSGDTFDHLAAEGFIKLWSLPTRTMGRARQSRKR